MIPPFVFAPVLAAALHFSPASAIDLGGTRLVQQMDPTAALAGVQVVVAAGLDRESPAQNGLAALAAEAVLGSATPSGRSVKDAAAAAGGSITYAIEPQATRFYIEARPEQIPAVTALLAAAMTRPQITPQSLAAAKASLRDRIADNDRSALAVIGEMVRSTYYTGSGANLATYGTRAVVDNLRATDVTTFIGAYYRRGDVVFSAVGAVSPAVVDAARGTLAALPPGAPPAVPVTRVVPLTDPAKRVITHREVGATWVGLGFAAPAPGERDFAAMLVIGGLVDAVFSPPGTGVAGLRPVGTQYRYDVKPANLLVYANGLESDPSSTLRQVLVLTKALAAKPLPSALIDRAKRAAIGSFVGDALTLDDRSARLGTFARLGVDPDYANVTLDALAAVTPADVQRAAKTYLQRYVIAVVLPRETSNP